MNTDLNKINSINTKDDYPIDDEWWKSRQTLRLGNGPGSKDNNLNPPTGSKTGTSLKDLTNSVSVTDENLFTGKYSSRSI